MIRIRVSHWGLPFVCNPVVLFMLHFKFRRFPAFLYCALFFLVWMFSRIHATDVVSTWDHSGDGSASGTGADTTVEEHAPTASYGTSDRLFVRYNSDLAQQRNSITALRFDLSQMNALEEGEVLGLELFDLRFSESNKADGQSFHL